MRPLIVLFCVLCNTAYGENKPLEIWLDADFTNHFESSRAIEIGAMEALRKETLKSMAEK